MKTEFEVKFYPVNKDAITTKLNECGAELVQPETKTVVAAFNQRTNPQIDGDYIRVRDEGNKVRLSVDEVLDLMKHVTFDNNPFAHIS